MLSAPLMLGNDIRKATPEIMEILLNKEVIAVNQDPLGKQGVKVRDYGDLEVWSKVLKDGSRAVVLFNRSDREVNIGVLWTEIGYPDHLKARIRDLWQKKDLGLSSGAYATNVPSHGVVMLKIVPK
jgi:alpha-galactosidase